MSALAAYPMIPATDGRHRRVTAPHPPDRDPWTKARCTSAQPDERCTGIETWCPKHQPHNYAQVTAGHRSPGPALTVGGA